MLNLKSSHGYDSHFVGHQAWNRAGNSSVSLLRGGVLPRWAKVRGLIFWFLPLGVIAPIFGLVVSVVHLLQLVNRPTYLNTLFLTKVCSVFSAHLLWCTGLWVVTNAQYQTPTVTVSYCIIAALIVEPRVEIKTFYQQFESKSEIKIQTTACLVNCELLEYRVL